MPEILFADNDYPDIDLERALFAPRRHRARRRAVQDRGRRDRGRARLPRHPAPVRADHRARRRGAAATSASSAASAPASTPIDTDACAKARRLGRQLARLRRGRGRHARAGAGAGARCATSSRYHRDIDAGQVALPVVGHAARAPSQHDARHRRASAGSASGWRTSRATCSSASSPSTRTSSTATSRPTSSARRRSRDLARRRTSSRCTCRSTAETRGMIDADVLRRAEARRVPRQHGARRGRRHCRRSSARSTRDAAPAPALDVLPEEPVPRDSTLLGAPARDPDAARRVLLGRGGEGVAPQGGAEHRHVARAPAGPTTSSCAERASRSRHAANPAAPRVARRVPHDNDTGEEAPWPR